jgi:hypothetical protein
MASPTELSHELRLLLTGNADLRTKQEGAQIAQHTPPLLGMWFPREFGSVLFSVAEIRYFRKAVSAEIVHKYRMLLAPHT